MALSPLRIKFVFLLAAFGLVVVINATTMLWSVLFLERQIDRPLRATQTALTLLSEAKRAAGEQHNDIARGTEAAAIGPRVAEGQGPLGRVDHVELLTRAAKAERATSNLLEAKDLEIVLGGGVPQYLKDRVSRANTALRTWMDSGDEDARAETLRLLFDLHERIETTETNVVKNASMASSHTDSMRKKVWISLAASVAIAILTAILAAQLVRRWVLAPVAELREAAERFARGELDYRVAVVGQGEIATLASEFNTMAGTIKGMQHERIERERLAAFGTATQRIVHNIKSPLAGIRMMAELAGDGADDAKEKLERIVSTVDRMNTWLKRLLDVSRPGELNTSITGAARWLNDILAPLHARAQGAGIEFEVDVSGAPEQARFDSAQLEQAVVALVSNALEATPKGGTVRVLAWSEKPADGPPRWGIDVADEGPGVSEEAAERLFQPYFTTKTEGSGIGLAMVQKVARDHGGDAWLRDAGEGHGAVFALWLPTD
ncbi:MAG: HAMP domain-containing histidine kinase [Phycisphaera sp.]|nr:MAG: HAMP domain-containing histidine kinase [Phycisphaera sp.]